MNRPRVSSVISISPLRSPNARQAPALLSVSMTRKLPLSGSYSTPLPTATGLPLLTSVASSPTQTCPVVRISRPRVRPLAQARSPTRTSRMPLLTGAFQRICADPVLSLHRRTAFGSLSSSSTSARCAGVQAAALSTSWSSRAAAICGRSSVSRINGNGAMPATGAGASSRSSGGLRKPSTRSAPCAARPASNSATLRNLSGSSFLGGPKRA